MGEMMEQKRLNDIVILRFVAITSLVTWHCFVCPYMCWDLNINSTPNYHYFRFVFPSLFPDANMPLFTFISGYLFYYLLNKGRYINFLLLVKEKAKRLLLPFLLIGTIISLSSYHRFVKDILWGGGSDLWYICMLFWCFIFTWTLEKINVKYLRLLMFLISLMLVIWRGSVWNFDHIIPFGIDHALYYFCYFYFGFFVFKNKETFFKFMRNYLWITIILYFTLALFILLHFHIIGKLSFAINTFLYCLILWTIINIFLQNNILRVTSWIEKISYYSFGIYVFHNWINWNTTHLPYITSLMNDHYVLFPIINTLSMFSLSYFLTHFIVKTTWGKYLLLS